MPEPPISASPSPTAVTGHQAAPRAPETPSPLPAPQHSSGTSQHMPVSLGTWHSHGPHPEPTDCGQGTHQLPAAGLVPGLLPAKHWLHACTHMGFLWGRFGSLFFCLFNGCQNPPSAQEQAQPKLGLPGGHHCAPGMAVPKVCALAHGLLGPPHSLFFQHPPEPFWGSLSIWKTPSPDRQGPGAGHAACTQGHTCSCTALSAPAHSACAAVGKPDASNETRPIVNRNREHGRDERDGVWQDMSHPEACRDQGHGDIPSSNPRAAWIGKREPPPKPRPPGWVTAMRGESQPQRSPPATPRRSPGDTWLPPSFYCNCDKYTPAEGLPPHRAKPGTNTPQVEIFI